MKIIDTHVHVWKKKDIALPWLDGEGELLNRDYSEKDYRNSLKPDADYQVEGAVYIEVDAAREHKRQENQMAVQWCQDSESLFIGACISGYLNEAGFQEYLEETASPYVKGVRQVLHVPESLPGTCLGEQFIRNVDLLGSKGMVFEGCVRNSELGDLYEMARQCPGTVIILNHMGIVNPDIIAAVNPTQEEKLYQEAWKKNIRNLASLGNVVCKVSGLNPAGDWDTETLRPAVDYCLDTFGEDRIMFASNYPVCNVGTEMTPWIDALLQITDGRGSKFQNKLFYENAKRVYKL